MVEPPLTFNIEVVWVLEHNKPQIHNLELLCSKAEAFLSDSDHVIMLWSGQKISFTQRERGTRWKCLIVYCNGCFHFSVSLSHPYS